MSKNKNQNKGEYRQFVRKTVEDGTFFKDSLDWYLSRYVSPLCDRTWLFFITVISVILTYGLLIMIDNAFPIKQSFPVVIKAKDTALYNPKISSLNDSEDLRTIDEAVVKRLLIEYLKEREEYDFATMTINDLNQKIRIIKNNSSLKEHQKFISYVGSSDKNSPVNNFGKNISTIIAIRYFNFNRISKENFISKAKNFVYEPLPTQADIGFQLTTDYGDKKDVRNYVARIDFKFSKIDGKNLDKELIFEVNGYNLFIDNK